MPRYAVALHLKKQLDALKSTETIDLRLVEANSPEEALGKIICSKDADWQLGAFKARLIVEETE